MSEWVPIALSDLYSYLEFGLVDKLNKGDLATNQQERFTVASSDVIQEFRQRLQSFPGVVVSATDGTIPPELKRHACQLILLAMSYATPGIVFEKGVREEWMKCRDVFKEIKDGTFRITAPDDPMASSVQRYAPSEVIKTTPRSVTICTMKGVI